MRREKGFFALKQKNIKKVADGSNIKTRSGFENNKKAATAVSPTISYNKFPLYCKENSFLLCPGRHTI